MAQMTALAKAGTSVFRGCSRPSRTPGPADPGTPDDPAVPDGGPIARLPAGRRGLRRRDRPLRPRPSQLSRRPGGPDCRRQPGSRRARRRLRYGHLLPAVPGGRLPGARRRPRLADGRAGQAGGTPAEVAMFEDSDPAGRSFDAVIAAQAWHWVTRSRARRGPPRCCGRVAGWRVLERLRAARGAARGVRRGLRAGAARLAVRRILEAPRGRRLPAGIASGGRRDAPGRGFLCGRRVAVPLGAPLYQGGVA